MGNDRTFSKTSCDPEKELLPTLMELGIGFTPFSPLGKVMLPGRVNAATKFEADDFKSTHSV